MATFPAELVQQFIWHLNEDVERLKHLISCCLVSQAWCAVAQPLLYRRGVLNLPSRTKTSIIDIISTFPHLRTWVKHLLVIGKLDWITSSALSVSLPLLVSLQIRSEMGGMSPGLVQVLQPMLSGKYLVSLELSDLTKYPVNLFYQCVALTSLALRRVTLEFPAQTSESGSDDGETSSQLKERLPLISFLLWTKYREGVVILDWLLSPQSPFDLSRLETFIGLDRCDLDSSYEAHCNFISHVSSSLKTVLIDPPTICLAEDLDEPLGLLQPRELHSITSITISVIQEQGRELSALPWLIAFLSGLPNPESLHQLTLLCDLYDHSPFDSDFFSKGWAQLDEVLTRFRNLHRVDLKTYDEPDESIAQFLVSWFYDRLPMLNDKGLLVVKCFPDSTYTPSVERELLDGPHARF